MTELSESFWPVQNLSSLTLGSCGHSMATGAVCWFWFATDWVKKVHLSRNSSQNHISCLVSAYKTLKPLGLTRVQAKCFFYNSVAAITPMSCLWECYIILALSQNYIGVHIPSPTFVDTPTSTEVPLCHGIILEFIYLCRHLPTYHQVPSIETPAPYNNGIIELSFTNSTYGQSWPSLPKFRQVLPVAASTISHIVLDLITTNCGHLITPHTSCGHNSETQCSRRKLSLKYIEVQLPTDFLAYM